MSIKKTILPGVTGKLCFKAIKMTLNPVSASEGT